jgi:hypothetical protein
MSRWFRSYADTHRNPKVAKLTDRQFRLWHNLMCVAAENDGTIPSLDDLKGILKARLDHLSTGVEALIKGGLIDRLEVGYAPHNWAKRQYKSDTSTDRVQKHRGKRNVSETPPEAETETETKVVNISRGARLPDDFVVPDEWITWALGKRRWSRAEAVDEGECFVRYWTAKAGKDAVKRNWQSTWQNWVSNSRRGGTGFASSQPRVPL